MVIPSQSILILLFINRNLDYMDVQPLSDTDTAESGRRDTLQPEKEWKPLSQNPDIEFAGDYLAPGSDDGPGHNPPPIDEDEQLQPVIAASSKVPDQPAGKPQGDIILEKNQHPPAEPVTESPPTSRAPELGADTSQTPQPRSIIDLPTAKTAVETANVAVSNGNGDSAHAARVETNASITHDRLERDDPVAEGTNEEDAATKNPTQGESEIIVIDEDDEDKTPAKGLQTNKKRTHDETGIEGGGDETANDSGPVKLPESEAQMVVYDQETPSWPTPKYPFGPAEEAKLPPNALKILNDIKRLYENAEAEHKANKDSQKADNQPDSNQDKGRQPTEEDDQQDATTK